MKENDNNSLAETLVNYEMLIEMIPELGEVVYTGMVTLDAAKAVFQELSEVNQIDFVESLDYVKRMLQQRDSDQRDGDLILLQRLLWKLRLIIYPCRKLTETWNGRMNFSKQGSENWIKRTDS